MHSGSNLLLHLVSEVIVKFDLLAESPYWLSRLQSINQSIPIKATSQTLNHHSSDSLPQRISLKLTNVTFLSFNLKQILSGGVISGQNKRLENNFDGWKYIKVLKMPIKVGEELESCWQQYRNQALWDLKTLELRK